MKALTYFLSGLLLACLCSCVGKPIDETISSMYRNSWGSVYYTNKADNTWIIYGNKIKGADAKTFEPLAETVARDKKNVYYRTVPQPQIDRESFQVKEDGTMRDKNHIYISSLKDGDESILKVLYGVDLTTYGSYKGHVGWGHDKNHVYQGYSQPVDADPATFTFLSDHFMKDKDFLYTISYSGLVKIRTHTDSLVVLNETYVRDNHRIYFLDIDSSGYFTSVPFNPGDSIIPLQKTFLIVGNKVLCNGHLLNGGNIDATSFEMIDENYSKDTSSIFCSGKAIPSVDRKSFEVLTDGFAKDKNTAYFYGHKLTNVDVSTFKIINSLYFKDKNEVYFIYSPPGNKGFFKIVKDADPETFYHNPQKSLLFGADKKNEFYNGETIIKN